MRHLVFTRVKAFNGEGSPVVCQGEHRDLLEAMITARGLAVEHGYAQIVSLTSPVYFQDIYYDVRTGFVVKENIFNR